MSQSNSSAAQNPSVKNASGERLAALLLVLREQVDTTLEKVQLLASMGLTHTAGYAEAVKAYEMKVKAYDEVRAQLGA